MRTFPKGDNGDRNWLNHPISLTLIAFAVTSAPALLLHKWSEKNLGSIQAMALALLIGGIVMWIIDAWAARHEFSHTRRRRDDPPPGHLDRPLPDALRHLSRHLALHVHHRRRPDWSACDRPAALEFSFLLSIPTMIAATFWDLLKETPPHSRRSR